jgi:hypothetical protein
MFEVNIAVHIHNWELFILIGSPFSRPFVRHLLLDLLLLRELHLMWYLSVTTRSSLHPRPTPDEGPSDCPRVPQGLIVLLMVRSTLVLMVLR